MKSVGLKDVINFVKEIPIKISDAKKSVQEIIMSLFVMRSEY